jgi:NAD(P)-dependent dehydrogenase (short-subunit alcohol dehydrogenase family)
MKNQSPGKLAGKTAIVTGGAGGIGAATAKLFVQEAANVLLVDQRAHCVNSRRAGQARRNLPPTCPACDTERYVARAVERFGGLDILFANAGIEGVVARIIESSLENFERVLAVTVRGAWLALRAAIPQIAKRGGGSIVLTSSIAGLVGSPGLSAYVASKHALVGLTKVAALECAPLGIHRANPADRNRMMQSIEDNSPQCAPKAKQACAGAAPPLRNERRFDSSRCFWRRGQLLFDRRDFRRRQRIRRLGSRPWRANEVHGHATAKGALQVARLGEPSSSATLESAPSAERLASHPLISSSSSRPTIHQYQFQKDDPPYFCGTAAYTRSRAASPDGTPTRDQRALPGRRRRLFAEAHALRRQEPVMERLVSDPLRR